MGGARSAEKNFILLARRIARLSCAWFPLSPPLSRVRYKKIVLLDQSARPNGWGPPIHPNVCALTALISSSFCPTSLSLKKKNQ